MSRFKFPWTRPFYSLAAAGTIALLAWPFLGTTTAFGTFSGLLLMIVFHHFRQLGSLYRWLQAPRIEALPVGSGSWEYIFSPLLRLLRRQKQTEKELAFALQRSEQAGAALPDALIILDSDGRVQWCNPRAQEYFGLDNQRDRGQQITNILRQPQFVEHLFAGRVGETVTLRVPRDRGELTLSIQLVPYGEQEKLLLARDITRWERLETMRRDFVANVSHELRTPLTVIGGFLETLEDMKTLDADMARRFIALMQLQAGRMSRLVEDLLTLSRLESSNNPLREEEVDIAELVRGVHQDALALSGGQHKISLKIDCQDWLRGNREELRSAFGNLVSNAIRYTPPQGEVEIFWQDRDGQLVFGVRDSGIGIEPQHIERLTERFYRVDRGRSRETGGTGLGLAIVKHVLNRHHSGLDIQSEPGRGSVFSVVFPDTRRLASPVAAQSA